MILFPALTDFSWGRGVVPPAGGPFERTGHGI